jgi:glycosyltransferase involved in cell wall biosynthesis
MLSVVVPTRNRAAQILPCAEAILRNPSVDELIIVDQSDGTDTHGALEAVRDPRLRYWRSDLRGELSGRNTGFDLARGDLVAFTDDDCRAAPDWAQRLVDVFSTDPSAAVVCGRVQVPEELRARGFAISFEPRTREWQGRFPAPDRGDWGINANLSVRREVFDRVGRFDPLLGGGAPLLSGGEPDLLFRVLRAGLKVVNASEVLVDHLGIRAPGDECRALWRSYGAGTGAAIFKHVRVGDPLGIRLYLRFLGACGVWNAKGLLRGERPIGIGYSVAFVAGSLRSFRFGVDRRTRMYMARP